MGVFSQLARGVDWSSMGAMGLRIVAVLLCLVVHEVCHGLAAYWLGDPTAKRSHRLSLNPIHHLDIFGLLMMIVVGFGWAKPVRVDPRYFKNPKKGMAHHRSGWAGIQFCAGLSIHFVLQWPVRGDGGQGGEPGTVSGPRFLSNSDFTEHRPGDL